MISDSEIIELEQLLLDRDKSNRLKSLTEFNDKTSINYISLFNAINDQKFGRDENNKPALIDGYAGFVLEGSSRSSKTWASCFIIIYLGLIKHKDDGCTINVYRETYNEFKGTLYEDFKRILTLFNLPNKFDTAEEIKSFRIGKSKVTFHGDGKHGGGCDYAFFNEAMMIKESVFNQVKIRCRKFWWMDYNPSFTQHWVFDKVLKRKDVGFLRTTFKDNPFISATELNEILGYEPWESNSYTVEHGVIVYDGEPVDDTHQPPPHTINKENGTADEFMWKVYGLGLRGSMKGQIFKLVTYIDKFPNDIAPTYGLDFGFTSDPSALVKYGQQGRNIYLELLLYTPTETADMLDAALTAIGISKYDPITADSSDKYVSERKGTTQMVRELFDKGWEISKVSKTKSIMYWLLDMRDYKIHIVKSGLIDKFQTEVENYTFKEVNGILINQPIDKFNHAFDSARYAHMSHDINNLTVGWE